MSKQVSSNSIAFFNILSTVILYSITFFSAPIFARLLGTEDYGVVQVYNSWVSFFTVIVGLMTRATLAIAQVHYEGKKLQEYQSSVLFLSLVTFVFVFVTVSLFRSYFVRLFELDYEFVVLMLCHSFATYCIYFVNAKFTYEMKAKNNMLISVVLALIVFGLSYFLITQVTIEHPYVGRILGSSVTYIVAGIFIVIFVLRQGGVFYKKEYWLFCLPLCLPLIFHGISGIICANIDRVMIQKMIGLSAVGIYALAINFANVMDTIWCSLNNSWTPFFYEFLKKGQLYELKHRSKNYILLFSTLASGFILLTPEVYQIFAPSEYHEGAFVIPIAVLSIYSIFIYSFAANYEFYSKRTDILAIGSVVAGLFNVVFNLVFIKVHGYIGAAFATLLANIVLVFMHIYFAKKIVKEKWVYSIGMYTPSVIMVVISCYLFYSYYDTFAIRFFVSFVIGSHLLFRIYKTKQIF